MILLDAHIHSQAYWKSEQPRNLASAAVDDRTAQKVQYLSSQRRGFLAVTTLELLRKLSFIRRCLRCASCKCYAIIGLSLKLIFRSSEILGFGLVSFEQSK